MLPAVEYRGLETAERLGQILVTHQGQHIESPVKTELIPAWRIALIGKAARQIFGREHHAKTAFQLWPMRPADGEVFGFIVKKAQLGASRQQPVGS